MAETLMLLRACHRVLAVPSGALRRVVPAERLAPMPGTAGALLGLMPASGRAVPVVDLSRLTGLPEAPVTLAVICQVGPETLALPVQEVLGFVQEDGAASAELLGPEVLLGGYTGGGQKGQRLNLGALYDRLAAHLSPV
ncbi:chemotaxis protein CheW [Deinococcus ficus]|uniref:chemotaxis protein CheW n=1 Tax=Deinococcus ficus TaxID=317577 RepID=UPI001994AB75|nr:chemotaxis protein CheW [Deinococcus ficus]GHF78952.1 hypothetical protein GCM10017782_16210 [Deinococcus ficus]